ncbi:IMP dehydrogenase, partial [Staphylococcus epidermidis]|uniref:IMP dehydrogenase n=1 Tax=Staphylococcus epidermidis TaxID=1282 RepID=UPI0037D9E63D
MPILTNPHLPFIQHFSIKISHLITKHNLITPPLPTTLHQPHPILQKHNIHKLPLLQNPPLQPLITIKHIEKLLQFPYAPKHQHPTFLPPPPIPTSKHTQIPPQKLLQPPLHPLIIHTPHPHSKPLINQLKHINQTYPQITLLPPDLPTPHPTPPLFQPPPHLLKLPIPPPSISTTPLVPPLPLPQITPLYHSPTQPPNHRNPIIPHPPINFSPHIIKPLPAAPHPVILPTFLPPTEQSPPPTQLFQRR